MNQEETYERSEQQRHFRTIILSWWAYTNKTDTKKKRPVPVRLASFNDNSTRRKFGSERKKENGSSQIPFPTSESVFSSEIAREAGAQRSAGSTQRRATPEDRVQHDDASMFLSVSDISDELSGSTNPRDHSQFGGSRELMGERAHCAVRGAEWQHGRRNSSLGTATI
ncbi:hypothetical protein BLNAU_17268 [Blattamonas nauphoetae]|uniref:Uncharacterized protein n=1 Tax=Blattamonas nauphoetae TaxID=2049346 RepID=A0ABQ9X7T1_9EUKA|nr:hypothetical protein BLNAU_17268 [Blattamonas nauphoetae]